MFRIIYRIRNAAAVYELYTLALGEWLNAISNREKVKAR